MESQEVYLTNEELERTRNQLEYLRTIKRAEVAQYLHDARESDDVIDTEAYEEARRQQAYLEGRILELEQLLAKARLRDHARTDVVSLGSVVHLRTSEGREYRYQMVGPFAADPKAGKISSESPVGKMLLGHKAGDVVIVSTPGGVKEYTILGIGWDDTPLTSPNVPDSLTKDGQPKKVPPSPGESLAEDTQPIHSASESLNDLSEQLPKIEPTTTEQEQIQPRSFLTVRIMEEPLTAYNLTMILSALTELYTKCWLVQQNRLADLIEYTQTHDPRFTREAGLLIHKLTHNSPAEIKLDVGIREIAEAIGIGIDGVVQAPLRREEAKLDNQTKALDNQIKQMEAQDEHAAKEQARQLELQQAVIDQQEKQLMLEAKRLELEAKRLTLLEQRLEIEKKRVEYALDLSVKMISVVQPNADQQTKEVLARTFLPGLLQIGNSTGLTLIALSDDASSS